MVFSSLLFLFYFLPPVLALYYLAPRQLKNLVLLIASLIFYAWGEPVYIVLMLFSAAVDYSHGLLIERWRHRPLTARWFVLSSVLVNLGLLGFFKYAGFFMENINALFHTGFDPLDLPLPIGISFYTFQTMSYTIDVYRGSAPVQRNFVSFAAYVSLFPQLIAGPIVRYKTIAHQLSGRRESIDLFAQGIKRFVVGLGKKVLLANNIGMLWAEIQTIPAAELPVLTAWLGLVAFGFQIYFDFSGYSDMAIGLGRMLGFTFQENFNYPYIARSITEFWRRWHISLGTWFRDYVYIPLGGNRLGLAGQYRNLLLVWLLTGFWHGASWNFVLWGLWFAVLLACEKAGMLRLLERLPRAVGHLYVIGAALLGWLLFVAADLPDGPMAWLKVLFGLASNPLYDARLLWHLAGNGTLLAALTLGSTPLPSRAAQLFSQRWRAGAAAAPAFYLLLLLAVTAYLVDASYNPFLYFRF